MIIINHIVDIPLKAFEVLQNVMEFVKCVTLKASKKNKTTWQTSPQLTNITTKSLVIAVA